MVPPVWVSMFMSLPVVLLVMVTGMFHRDGGGKRLCDWKLMQSSGFSEVAGRLDVFCRRYFSFRVTAASSSFCLFSANPLYPGSRTRKSKI